MTTTETCADCGAVQYGTHHVHDYVEFERTCPKCGSERLRFSTPSSKAPWQFLPMPDLPRDLHGLSMAEFIANVQTDIINDFMLPKWALHPQPPHITSTIEYLEATEVMPFGGYQEDLKCDICSRLLRITGGFASINDGRTKTKPPLDKDTRQHLDDWMTLHFDCDKVPAYPTEKDQPDMTEATKKKRRHPINDIRVRGRNRDRQIITPLDAATIVAGDLVCSVDEQEVILGKARTNGYVTRHAKLTDEEQAIVRRTIEILAHKAGGPKPSIQTLSLIDYNLRPLAPFELIRSTDYIVRPGVAGVVFMPISAMLGSGIDARVGERPIENQDTVLRLMRKPCMTATQRFLDAGEQLELGDWHRGEIAGPVVYALGSIVQDEQRFLRFIRREDISNSKSAAQEALLERRNDPEFVHRKVQEELGVESPTKDARSTELTTGLDDQYGEEFERWGARDKLNG